MKHYAIFGGCLRSDIPLDELPEIEAAPPQWIVRLNRDPLAPAEFLGEEHVNDQTRVRCSRVNGGIRLQFDDTGTFDIARGGTNIAWTPGPDGRAELVRADLLGGVLGTALHLQGVLCLHGSAVSIAQRAVVFLARKGTGKSTIAAAMTLAGASFISDDMVPVETGPPPVVWPVAPTIRLLSDSAVRLRMAGGRPVVPSSGKYHHAPFSGVQLEHRRVSLVAIYELTPMPRATPSAAQRVKLSGADALVTLLRNHRTGIVIGDADSRALVSRSADIAAQASVYRLEVTRDLNRLDEVADAVLGWHRGAAS